MPQEHYKIDSDRFEEMLAVYLLRPVSEYHEDFGPALFWKLPVNSPPEVEIYAPVGFTHWSPLPDCRTMTVADGKALTA